MNETPLRVLMCAPDFFQVDYIINPWMEGNVGKTIRSQAEEQWRAFHARLDKVAKVELIDPQAGLPDMVFTANAGVVLGRKFVLGHFLYRERRAEEPHFRRWFEEHGFEVFEMPADLPCEGAGDALLDRAGGWLWAAYGLRTELDAHPLLAQWLDVEVVSLRLIDQRFYHLDTCLCPLEGGWLLYYPGAFDAYSNQVIEKRVARDKRIPISEADALSFACNAANAGRRIFLDRASPQLTADLQQAGFDVVQTPLRNVQRGVPFVLAGSIRDDGPLPDTMMDLIKAQEAYARQLAGADMILMLASMLHSIGVGNMTPAGVKLVCVDINPAVVTKLSDRGSIESVGVVTDVGSFLKLLAWRLQGFENAGPRTG